MPVFRRVLRMEPLLSTNKHANGRLIKRSSHLCWLMKSHTLWVPRILPTNTVSHDSMHDERDSTEGAHCVVSASIMFTDCSAAPSEVVRNGLSPCSLSDIDYHVMDRITQSVEVEPCSGLNKWVLEGDWTKALRYVRGGGHPHSECKDINQTTTITTS